MEESQLDRIVAFNQTSPSRVSAPFLAQISVCRRMAQKLSSGSSDLPLPPNSASLCNLASFFCCRLASSMLWGRVGGGSWIPKGHILLTKGSQERKIVLPLYLAEKSWEGTQTVPTRVLCSYLNNHQGQTWSGAQPSLGDDITALQLKAPPEPFVIGGQGSF